MNFTAAVLLSMSLMVGDKTLQAQQGKKHMPNTAQEYLAAFEQGQEFSPPVAGLTAKGVPDPAALNLLGQKLAVESPSVRENIVHLVVDLGRQTDPLTPRGADVIRNAAIIDMLAGPGLAKHDTGRDAAMDALRKLVMPADLEKHGEQFARALFDAPSDEAFLLVAKAKPLKFRQQVEDLGRQPRWNGQESARVARAALGNAGLETEYIVQMQKAQAEGKGEEMARALGTLALIGTERCLITIAEQLRTPLTQGVPGAFTKSVRLDVLSALLYDFPEVPELYPNNIKSDADYIAAEHWCEKTFKVTYTTPRPPYLTYRGEPMPLPR